MSVTGCRIRAMTINWTKNTYVCDPDECDTLIEITTSDEFGFPSGTIHNVKCPCGRTPNLLSVEPATIHPINERKEMEKVTHDAYAPHQLVTLKQITGEDVEFQLYKVTELETVLHDTRTRVNSLTARLEAQEKQIGLILNKMTADEWYSSNVDKSEVLSDLCDILGHEPKQTVRITATVSVEVDYDIPLDEVEDFDARYFLNDNLTVDIYNGDAVVDSFDIEDADVNW